MLESWQHARETAASCGGCPCVSRITRSKGRRHATDGREYGNADTGLGEEDTTGAVSRPALHVRAVWWGLWALVLSALLCTPAYAVTTQILIDGNTYFYPIDHPDYDPNHQRTGLGYMVVADDAYTAALAVLGKDGTSLTADQKALLSNESTGGAFYTFVESFKNLNQAPSPAWSSPEFTAGAGVTFGKGNVWIVTTNSGDIASATEDYEVIEDGGTLGGGGNNEPIGNTYILTKSVLEGNYNRHIEYNGNNYYLNNYTASNGIITEENWPNGNSITIINNSTLQLDEYTDIFIYITFNTNTTYRYNIIIVKPNTYTITNENLLGYTIQLNAGQRLYYVTGTVNVSDAGVPFNYNLTLTNLQSLGNSYSLNSTPSLYYRSVDSGTPIIPPTNWPEPEVPTTDPFTPEVPTPQNPTVPVQPTPPTNPTVDPPTVIQVPTQGPDPTGTDYTPYLIDILHELQDFETLFVSTMNSLFAELESHCYHLRMALHNEIGYLAQSFSYSLNTEITSLANYLHELFEWLAAQLQSDVVNEYDDSSVLYWLRRIWLQLGGSEPKVVSDDDGAGEFWLNVLKKLFDMMFDNGSQLIDDVVDFFDGLKEIFPFSIPWDVAAILGLLVAAPETPAVDLTITEPLSGGVMRFQGDLHWLDGSMGAVRQMELIAFTVYLLWRTRDVLDLFKVGD